LEDTVKKKIEDLRFEPGPDPGIDDLMAEPEPTKQVMTEHIATAVNPDSMIKVFEDRGYRITQWREIPTGEGRTSFQCFVHPRGRTLSVIVSSAPHPDVDGVEREWIHASMAGHPEGIMPTYEDLATLHRAVFGRRRWSYQVFAADSRHVNIRANALHLWGRADGANVLPDFGRMGTI
jgi:hypothetical protein